MTLTDEKLARLREEAESGCIEGPQAALDMLALLELLARADDVYTETMRGVQRQGERIADLEGMVYDMRAERDAAYARGRADERADVVRWLRDDWECDDMADDVERGEHVAKERG